MKLKSLALAVGLVSSIFVGVNAMAAESGDQIAAIVYSPIKAGTPNMQVDGPTLKVATYNIGSVRISDMQTVIAGVKAIDADFISLNEVDNKTGRSGNVDQAFELSKATGMYYAFGRAIDFDGGEYGVAFLSKYPIINQEVVELPSDDAEQRIVLLSEVKVPGVDSPIIFMTTHLDFTEDHVLQMKQVRAINDLVVANTKPQKIEDFTNKIKILCGDFNDTYNGPTTKELSRYWNIVVSDDPNDMRTWPASNPLADLDHIYTSRGQIWELKDIDVLSDNERGIDWDKTSDHQAVVATLKLLEQ